MDETPSSSGRFNFNAPLFDRNQHNSPLNLSENGDAHGSGTSRPPKILLRRKLKERSSEKWKRIIKPADDSDSSDWSDDNVMGKLNEILAKCEVERGQSQMQSDVNSANTWRPTSSSITLGHLRKKRRTEMEQMFMNCTNSVTNTTNSFEHPSCRRNFSRSQIYLPVNNHLDWYTDGASSLSRAPPTPPLPPMHLPNLSPLTVPATFGRSSQLSSPVAVSSNDIMGSQRSENANSSEQDRDETQEEEPQSHFQRNEETTEVQVIGSTAATILVHTQNDNAIVPDVEPTRSATPLIQANTPPTQHQNEESELNSSREVILVENEQETHNTLPRSENSDPPQPESDGNLNQSLINLMECPVCLDYVMPPIHQCKRGHLVCNSCKPQLTNCPTCRSRFTDVRNLILEKVMEKLHYPCKNYLSGCEGRFRLKDKTEHESNCYFRTYKCIIPQCNWKGFLQEYLGHMNDSHSNIVVSGEKQVLHFSLGSAVSTSQNWIVTALGQIFHANLLYSHQKSQIFGSVQYIGPRKRAQDFLYTLEISNKNDLYLRKISYSRVTHSELGKLSLYYHNGDCFCIRADGAKLVSEGRRLTVTLHLQNLNNNTGDD